MTTIELKFLETVSLDADLNFTAMLWSLKSKGCCVSRYNRSNDTYMLLMSRFRMNRANRAYVIAKQSLREVKL